MTHATIMQQGSSAHSHCLVLLIAWVRLVLALLGLGVAHLAGVLNSGHH